jgi:hypothetical protein
MSLKYPLEPDTYLSHVTLPWIHDNWVCIKEHVLKETAKSGKIVHFRYVTQQTLCTDQPEITRKPA